MIKAERKPGIRVQEIVVGAGVLVALACGGGGGGGGNGTGPEYTLVPVVTGANFPTQIRFAPDGRLFYIELDTGNIRVVENGTLLSTPFATLPTATAGEQGLLGLAIDPDFASNHYIYAFHTHPNPLRQRVVRFTADTNVGTGETVIVDDLPAANNHCGGRIGFGSDGKLYVTLGDVGVPSNSQDDNVLPGKLLRYNANGSIPADNPIPGNPMFAKGLRNPFGLAFHPTTGTPYVSENGPTCDDELNRIVSGGNYGWRSGYPCGDDHSGFVAPLQSFNPSIAPTGVAFYTGNQIPALQGRLLMGSFKDGALRAFAINDSGSGSATPEGTIVTGRPGGLIDVTTGIDGHLYISDSTGIYRVIRN